MGEETENGSVGRYGMATSGLIFLCGDAVDAAFGAVSALAISLQGGSVHAAGCTRYGECLYGGHLLSL